MTLRGMVPRGGYSPLRSSISPRTKSFLIKKVSVLSPSRSASIGFDNDEDTRKSSISTGTRIRGLPASSWQI